MAYAGAGAGRGRIRGASGGLLACAGVGVGRRKIRASTAIRLAYTGTGVAAASFCYVVGRLSDEYRTLDRVHAGALRVEFLAISLARNHVRCVETSRSPSTDG
ncbi:hypothetical protein GCM10009565_17540 [Amycolatopsis albidoflavus]